MSEKKKMEPDRIPEDFVLIAAYLGGDNDAFAVLYERYKRQVYRYLNDLLPGRQSDADDVFQRTWLKAIDSLARYRDEGYFLAWLLRIARNEFLDRMRSERRRGAMELRPEEDAPEEAGPPGGEPWRELDASELGIVLNSALAELPPEQREVFVLRQEELSFKEIAEMQKCSINTALGRMQYALRNLRRILERIDAGGLLP